MKLTNQQIYSLANSLKNFCPEGKIPVKVNFFLQKNIQIIFQAAKEIEDARLDIAKFFGSLNESNTHYVVPLDKMEEAQQELNDLLLIEQDLNLHIFKLEDFNNIELTYQQLQTIMFMIEE